VSESIQRERRRGLPLYVRVVIGVALGAILGVAFKNRPYLLGLQNDDLGQLGLLVIKLLAALATPLILFAILDAFARTRLSARHGGRLIFICLVNVSVAMTIGLTIMNLLHPGAAWQGHMDELRQAIHPRPLEAKKAADPDAPKPSLNIIENVSYYVPSSLVRPFLYNSIITVVLLGLLGGAALRVVKDRQAAEGQTSIQTVERFIEAVYQILIQMLDYVIQAIPFAVFGIVAQVVGKTGLDVFQILAAFLVTILLGLGIHSLIYYPLIAWLWGRKPPKVYLGQGADAILTGLSTNSSLATVPVTLRCLTEKMGVSQPSARLAACVGTNLNNDGITLYEAMTALFLAQAIGENLGLGQQLFVVLAAIMAGAGVAGVPEAGLIVLPLVLGAAGLPEGVVALAIPLIVPVDWIIARCRSGVNVMSDMLVAILLDAQRRPEERQETEPQMERTFAAAMAGEDDGRSVPHSE